MSVVRLYAIVPRRQPPYKEREFERAMRRGARRAANEIKTDFQKTTRTWKRKVRFEIKIDLNYDRIDAAVFTWDWLYSMLDAGTKPHTIYARRKALKIPKTYTAKTTPDFIGSRQGGPGRSFGFFAKAEHPGTRARRWGRAIYLRHVKKNLVQKYVQQEVSQVAERKRS